MSDRETLSARDRFAQTIATSLAALSFAVVLIGVMARPVWSQPRPDDLSVLTRDSYYPSIPRIRFTKYSHSTPHQYGALWFRIDKGGNSTTDKSLEKLVGQSDLWALDVGRSPITGIGFHDLQRHRLLALRLNRTLVTDGALAELVSLEELQYLDLSVAPITDAGMAHVAKLKNLRWLELNMTYVSDVGVAALAPLEKLEALELKKTQITDATLTELERFPRLRHVSISSPYLTSDAALSFVEPRKSRHVEYEALNRDQAFMRYRYRSPRRETTGTRSTRD